MRRPNILILYTDQQRWDALGSAGNPDIQTPNLDRLAATSARFSHHFVQSPVCMPSRASFLSGQYPANLGITHMGVPLPESIPLISHYLRPYGYRTANIGKLHALPHANRDHRNPHPLYGFDHLEISDEPGPYEDAYRAWVRAQDPDALDGISAGLPPTAEIWLNTMGLEESVHHPPDRLPLHAVPFPVADNLTHTAFVSAQTRAFIASQRANPWLCIAGFYSPHSPWIVPQQYLDRYDPDSLTLPSDKLLESVDPRGKLGNTTRNSDLRSIVHGYYAMISEVDDHVGRILKQLEASGVADSTMIVFTSDHGEWLGQFGRFGKGYPADDAISRVPLMIHLPGTTTGRDLDTIVEAVDVLPTILDVAAIQTPPVLQGTSLLPLILGLPQVRPNAAITEHHGWKSMRTPAHRYLVEADGSEHLYALATDSHCLNDLAFDGERQPELATCRGTLLNRLIARERPIERTWTY